MIQLKLNKYREWRFESISKHLFVSFVCFYAFLCPGTLSATDVLRTELLKEGELSINDGYSLEYGVVERFDALDLRFWLKAAGMKREYYFLHKSSFNEIDISLDSSRFATVSVSSSLGKNFIIDLPYVPDTLQFDLRSNGVQVSSSIIQIAKKSIYRRHLDARKVGGFPKSYPVQLSVSRPDRANVFNVNSSRTKMALLKYFNYGNEWIYYCGCASLKDDGPITEVQLIIHSLKKEDEVGRVTLLSPTYNTSATFVQKSQFDDFERRVAIYRCKTQRGKDIVIERKLYKRPIAIGE